ncbi:penicillin-binding protein 2 [Patescibacteria group bacterium]|nr:penicillin-binding protein 2 [Patescibacteria group bacterium]MBU1705127.1 penicillin-binding protein 2 [Patescibacteria group bacterium]
MTDKKSSKPWQKTNQGRDWRIEAFRMVVVLLAFVIVLRLVSLQVLSHGFYQALANGQHEIFQELYPERGDIYFHDLKDGTLVPVATNQQLAFVYADPRHITDAEGAAKTLGEIFAYEAEAVEALQKRLDQPEDPYEPIAHRVGDQQLDQIIQAQLPGIYFAREQARLYPEAKVGGHVIGFLGMNKDGSLAGKYGVEGYFNQELAGQAGYLRSERDIAGRLIAVADRSIERAVDGADIVLTLDRTIQYTVCSALDQAVARYQADGGSAIVIDPHTGRVLAMCGAPDFDPNNYGAVDSINDFNNPAIFEDYEPGSIFKAITLAAALDTGAVTPTSTYLDTGEVKIDEHTIKNSDELAHGRQTMTQVLELSLNTGAIYAMRETGIPVFLDYVKRFGFGEPVGINLDTEVAGDLGELETGYEIYSATASYGQGITVTPLQMAAAYVPIANGGIYKKIHIVDELRYPDGRVVKIEDQDLRRVIESKTSRLLGAMLISVVDNGHAAKAAVSGYYLAGKTGTAQVANRSTGGYQENNTIASFVGFGPVEDPRFVILTRLDHPRTNPYAAQTAAPLFGEIAAFLLQYFEIPPTR